MGADALPRNAYGLRTIGNVVNALEECECSLKSMCRYALKMQDGQSWCSLRPDSTCNQRAPHDEMGEKLVARTIVEKDRTRHT